MVYMYHIFFIHSSVDGHFGCFHDLNIRLDTKLLEESIGRTLSDINCRKIFFDPPPRVMKIKTKINKWDLIKLKIFCTVKETIS